MGVFRYFIVRVQLDTVEIRPFIHQSIADSFFLIYHQKNSHSHNSNTDGECCPYFYSVSAVGISTPSNKIVFFGIYHVIL